MSELNCLRCQTPLDSSAEECPECGERVTGLQRTYGGKLIDGKYQILERLGVGGMGEIFKVRHIHLNEQRVIKIMRANIASDDQALQRFLHEARLATMIKHRNLAMLYDFSTLDDGSYYMVWEFIEGTNIQKWIATNGPMPPRLALEIAIQALSGLEAIHQMGIIHRDISPENIMLSQDPTGKLLVKVIDFGIAKQLSDSEGGQGLTQTGMFLGKLKYASPEQAGFIEEGEQLDARSDLYSFGVVFYEMLAGRAPFSATSPQAYILKHATEKPVSIRQMNADVDVPPKLEAVVFKALAKNRNERPATTGDFIQELEALRAEIAPDKKFGLGEKMITLSARPTAVDTRPTGTGRTSTGTAPGTTAGRPAPSKRPPGVAPTRPAADEATVVERKSTAGASEATLVDKTFGGGMSDATVAESLRGDAAATLIERSDAVLSRGAVARTVADERAPSRKSKLGLFAGLAAAFIAAAVLSVMYFMRAPAGPGETPTTSTTTAESGTSIPVTSTMPAEVQQALGKNEGVVLLSSHGQVEQIVDLTTGKSIATADADLFTPKTLQLPAGKYRLMVKDINGEASTHDVSVAAGQTQTIQWATKNIDYDQLAEEILQR